MAIKAVVISDRLFADTQSVYKIAGQSAGTVDAMVLPKTPRERHHRLGLLIARYMAPTHTVIERND